MRFATWNELDHLRANDRRSPNDDELVREMSRRLDALRRYDQYFSAADWRPRKAPGAQNQPDATA